jgi:hypothetical protein
LHTISIEVAKDRVTDDTVCAEAEISLQLDLSQGEGTVMVKGQLGRMRLQPGGAVVGSTDTV